MNTTAFFIGRFAPPHKGHITTILKLARKFDRVVIGLGSCYEVGGPRHPFLAIYREKMLLASLSQAGCDMGKVAIRHIQDFNDFDEWMEHISRLMEIEKVTHFVSGNEEDILSEFKKRGIKLGLKIINPEATSAFPYHASDLRRAITNGNYQKFLEIASSGTIDLMGSVNGFQGIKDAIDNHLPRFYHGRQTVDVVVTLSEPATTKTGEAYYHDYVLCGIRPDDKKDFPGFYGVPGDEILPYESPVDACLRSLTKKAGLKIELLDNKHEPAHLSIRNDKKKLITTLSFLGLFNTADERLVGSRGGSSQCFHIAFYGGLEDFNWLKDTTDLKELKFMRAEDALREDFAYEQSKMIQVALRHLNH